DQAGPAALDPLTGGAVAADAVVVVQLLALGRQAGQRLVLGGQSRREGRVDPAHQQQRRSQPEGGAEAAARPAAAGPAAGAAVGGLRCHRPTLCRVIAVVMRVVAVVMSPVPLTRPASEGSRSWQRARPTPRPRSASSRRPRSPRWLGPT